MNIAICDDNKEVRDELANMASRYFKDKDVTIDLFTGGEELLASLNVYDIVILDIELAGINGIDVAKGLRDRYDAAIIFVTAFKDYVSEAFDVEAVHYLLKPVDRERFEKALQKACGQSGRKKAMGDTFVVKTLEGFRTINIHELLYAENAGRKIALHMQKEIIYYYDKMGNLEQRLEGAFFRCHRGYLVSLSKIKRYDSKEIELVNGELILVSKQKYQEFVSAYQDFMGK